MGRKVTFIHADKFDQGSPNQGFDQQRDFVVLGNGYTFDDWLSDHDIRFNQDMDDCDTYFVIDNDLSAETRTGEAYRIIKIQYT